MKIRKIKTEDYQAVKDLVITAFSKSEHGYGGEAELVEKIRNLDSYDHNLELVAEKYDHIIGHVLLSEIKIQGINQYGFSLAPISVLPKNQNQKIGSQLMKKIEEQAKNTDKKFISILGNPDYYKKFGYKEAKKYNIKAPFEVPEKYYLIKSINDFNLNNFSGMIEYSSAFD
ncbi:GNAT family N-acetyltransferase [Lactobacillus sp. S2-2]|uniref:GNAT family N-acetyltransferase n=1 Tax=Lactobacillus sp. S2-2 TaxID=2692917 RepID=UPI001F3A4D7E|nr:N-acetyltransferase [Lactobacillus sp. S2-2]MCF6515493.1 GNAT family N-acetyltransferase [Lactobacillus sp. S2-2]